MLELIEAGNLASDNVPVVIADASNDLIVVSL